MKTNKATTLYSSYDSSSTTGSGTQTALSSSQYMTWRANKGNYYYVRLYNETSNGYTEGASGYVLKSACRTTYLGDTTSGLGRPWSNPYKSIYYGAKYIARSFTTQTSGYLQKFNVNPASSTLYSNEYMKNVAAAASEAETTYKGYSNAGILSVIKTFVIPVFNNMPDDTTTTSVTVDRVTGLTATSGNNYVKLSWTALSNVSGYYVYMYDTTAKKYKFYKNVSSSSLKISGLKSNKKYKFKVKAYYDYNGTRYKGKKSAAVSIKTKNKVVTVKSAKSSKTRKITVKWKK
ncbi:MAG: fibronectin type III domain-containing protein [Clostridiales bacterium]|nr:fibronectin type III domain-containing protein [Clostridiales bacterium]